MDRSAGLCSRNFIPQKAIAGKPMVLLDCVVFRVLQGIGGDRVSLYLNIWNQQRSGVINCAKPNGDAHRGSCLLPAVRKFGSVRHEDWYTISIYYYYSSTFQCLYHL